MSRPTHLACIGLAALLALGATGLLTAARAQICFHLDLDDDANPWTLRTETDEATETVKFILEVPAAPPTGRTFTLMLAEGCCNDIDEMLSVMDSP